jgi:hypothetical protein
MNSLETSCDKFAKCLLNSDAAGSHVAFNRSLDRDYEDTKPKEVSAKTAEASEEKKRRNRGGKKSKQVRRRSDLLYLYSKCLTHYCCRTFSPILTPSAAWTVTSS